MAFTETGPAQQTAGLALRDGHDPGQANETGRRRTKRRPLATAYVLISLALVLPGAMLTLSLLVTWNHIWAQAERTARQSAEGAAEYASRVLTTNMMVADRISEAARGVKEAEIRTDERRWHRLLQSHIARSRITLDAKLIGSDGTVLATASASPPPSASMAAREHFTALDLIPEGSLWISQSYERQGDGRRFFVISRARQLLDSGAVAVALDEERFGAGLARVSIDQGHSIAIIRRDGAVLTRYPAIPGAVQQLPPSARLRQDMAQGQVSGSFESQLPATNEAILVAFKRLSEHPSLYAVAVIPRAMILQQWWREVWNVLGFGLLAMAALGALAWRVSQQQLSLLKDQAELEARVAERSAQLADEGQRLALALDWADFGTWEIDLARGRVWRSPRLRTLFGLGETMPIASREAWPDAVHPDDLPMVVKCRDHALRGESEHFHVEFRFHRPDGTWVWLESFGHVVRRDPVTGKALIFTGVTRDITARKEAEARREVMIRELDHRGKNILAVIQSILRLSAKEDPARYAARVEGRIAVLSRAQALLSAEAWSGADLVMILRGELSVFAGGNAPDGAGRFLLEGPPVRLAVPSVQPLALAAHELASNAREHGSLQEPEGRIVIRWQMDQGAGLLRLRWVETGGPPAKAPARWSVGGKMIRASLQSQLQGSFTPEWRDAGFAADITLPIRCLTNHAA